jgi:hypothetical protein
MTETPAPVGVTFAVVANRDWVPRPFGLLDLAHSNLFGI